MKKRSILCVCIIALVAFAAWAPNAAAYQTYQSFSDTNPGPGDNCALCHPGFDNGLSISNAPSHAQHLNVTINCDLCHPTDDFGSIPVSTSSSVDGISCIGCHGRAEDEAGGRVTGAGLRQRHTKIGIFCGGCHQDNDPATFTTVGENVLPPYYSRADVNVKDPCLAASIDGGEDYSGNGRGLDNDGNLVYEANDWACGGTETVCDDGVDNDGDGLFDCEDVDDCGADPTCPDCTDNDGDTYNLEGGDCGPVDCDDTDPNVNPGATELCNGIDDNCDGTVDDGFPVGDACTAGVGVCQADGVLACTADGLGTECDATPGTPTETPEQTCDDNADNDCDGLIDCADSVDCGAAPNCATCTDNDGDTFNVEGEAAGCGPADCDDTDPDVFPGATELCNGIDDNCDGTVDEGFPVGDVCTAGVGVCEAQGTLACTADGLGTECDAIAGNPTETPEATCDDTFDNDCDGLTDCADTDDCGADPACDACTDNDGDTFNVEGEAAGCGPTDCDDNNADVNPGATEICNGIDDNCSGTIDDGFPVGDACTAGVGVCQADGVLACTADGLSTECDATPGTPTETPEMTCDDNADNDCDGLTDCADTDDCGTAPNCVACSDNDGDTFSPDGGDCGPVDCDDNNPDVNPGATELCNGIDDNCDGNVDEGFNVGDACTVGTGVCETPGTIVCTPDGTGSICDAEPGTPTEDPEMTCNDQLDNDCDAAIDCDDSDCVDDPACVVEGKVTICHIPPGNPKKARTKSVNPRSVAGHLAHGDTLGPCP